jgi:hypothetical protein
VSIFDTLATMNWNPFRTPKGREQMQTVLGLAVGVAIGKLIFSNWVWFKSIVGVEVAMTLLGLLFLTCLYAAINALWKWWLKQPNTAQSSEAAPQ